ncbi:MAG: hypothetical protein Q7R35_17675 [Elusimicrobiota bacterium]|nr:hypothetical protein [Elusimicrobiota bacterium]
MRLKELIRVIITEEMTDVSVYSVDADLYCSNPKIGDSLYELFTRLAHEKRTRLKALSKISKEGVGFRQRKTEGSCSIEACLRTHMARTKRSVQLYRDLLKLLDKPETQEILKDIISKERGYLTALKGLQAQFTEPQKPG